jgi:hypothetical protein
VTKEANEMSYPIQVPKQVEDVLTQSTSEQLVAVHNDMMAKFEAGRVDFEATAAVCGLISYELQLRQVEPLWRKATRFAKRNKEGLGIAAAVLGLAVGLDLAID